jgi:peptidoglycan L-alanyl-D-glutamate endopeptidase CwlK
MDKITLQRIELLHPKLRDEVREMYEIICNNLSNGVLCRFTHTLRTIKEQNDLYAKGRINKKERIVTNAKGGSSFHNYGTAIDFCIIVNGKATWDRGQDFDKDGQPDFMEVVKIFKSYGWTWGGDFKTFVDYPHFQKTFGYTTKQLLSLPQKDGYPII